MIEIIVTSKNFISVSINFWTCGICSQDHTEGSIQEFNLGGRESRPEGPRAGVEQPASTPSARAL